MTVLVGCSTFERDWNAVAELASTHATADAGITGRWRGIWRSDANGHHGGLRCIITTTDDGGLHARYHATYARVLTFEYDMPMTVEHDGATSRFAADADLGWLAGGRYEYVGTVVGDAFHATYESAKDHGIFKLRRAQP